MCKASIWLTINGQRYRIDRKSVKKNAKAGVWAPTHLNFYRVDKDNNELDDLTEEQRKAYIIADNQLALNSSWDDDLLQIELGNLLDNGFDLSVLGWGDDLPTFAEEPDYGLLDDIDDPNESLASNVYRGILLEFKPEDYEHARQLISDARKRGVYVGMKLIELLESIAE